MGMARSFMGVVLVFGILLQTLLNEDKSLLGDLVSIMDVNESRNFARRLLDCPVFGDLEKKSLMARIIKIRPETAELVNGEHTKKREEPLLVSWDSLERKKTELDELIRVRIPQNLGTCDRVERLRAVVVHEERRLETGARG